MSGWTSPISPPLKPPERQAEIRELLVLTHHSLTTSNPTCTNHPPIQNGWLQTQHSIPSNPAQDALSKHPLARRQRVPHRHRALLGYVIELTGQSTKEW